MKKMNSFWQDFFISEAESSNWWKRKQECWQRQKGEIIQIKGKGIPYSKFQYDDKNLQAYKLHLAFLIKQDTNYHLEEQTLSYQVEIENDKIINHQPIRHKIPEYKIEIPTEQHVKSLSRVRFAYDRREAVRYAERWWNSYNPEFRAFDVDCTNYISQCLLAGGAPMRGAPDRENGWWYQDNNWSFSWAVAHSMRWYLSGSTQGLQASEAETPEDLMPGDVICYDFEGNGRWDHTTIVVRHDAYGMPLVNAHTDNSRNRYWAYEDSAAWTPNIQYKFFRIGV